MRKVQYLIKWYYHYCQSLLPLAIRKMHFLAILTSLHQIYHCFFLFEISSRIEIWFEFRDHFLNGISIQKAIFISLSSKIVLHLFIRNIKYCLLLMKYNNVSMIIEFHWKFIREYQIKIYIFNLMTKLHKY